MTYSDILATAAIVISIASPLISWYQLRLDRPRLFAAAQFVASFDGNPEFIRMTLINRGRRPVIIRIIGGIDSNRVIGGTLVNSQQGGLRLGESERHDQDFYRQDTVQIDPEGNAMEFTYLAVETSVGDRTVIQGSNTLIRELWKR